MHFDTRGYAELHKQSIETAARNLRYGYFERLRHDIGAEAIVVAHHRDDNVETVLMNLVRGTGLNGMAGILSTDMSSVRFSAFRAVTSKHISGARAKLM